MARSAKTKHVLDLVGSESAKKPVPRSLREPTASPSILQRPKTAIPAAISPEKKAEETDEEYSVYSPEAAEAPEAPPKEPEEASKETKEAPEREAPRAGERMTAIVTELINQELETVVRRFNLTPTDSNLWELTRSAIETVRPEFSRNEEEYREKCERLRPRVIKEMTKAAIKAAAKEKKRQE